MQDGEKVSSIHRKTHLHKVLGCRAFALGCLSSTKGIEKGFKFGDRKL